MATQQAPNHNALEDCPPHEMVVSDESESNRWPESDARLALFVRVTSRQHRSLSVHAVDNF